MNEHRHIYKEDYNRLFNFLYFTRTKKMRQTIILHHRNDDYHFDIVKKILVSYT